MNLKLVVTFVALLSLLLLAPGCPWWKDHGQKIKAEVVDCTLDKVKAQVPSLVPTVTAILQGKPVNWKEQLDALATMGVGILACSIHVVIAELKQKAVVPPGELPTAAPDRMKARVAASEAAKLGEQYLVERKLTFK